MNYMKKLVIVAALVCMGSSLYGQGQLQFVNTSGAGSGFNTRVYMPDPAGNATNKTGNTSSQEPAGTQTYSGALVSGTGFTAELWAGPAASAEGSLAAVSSALGGVSSFRTGGAAGLWNAQLATIPGVPEGGTATIQVRVWDNRGGTITTWAAALAAGSTLAHGKSDVVQVPGLGLVTVTPPFPTNLRSFNLQAVPEPSTIALGVLGVGALLLRRRK